MYYSDMILEKIPEGKYAVVWYNNIHKYKTNTHDYFVNYVLKNLETQEAKVVSINIQESPAIPLGLIFKDKQASYERLGKIYTSLINIPKHSENSRINRQDVSLYKNEEYFALQEKIVLNDSHVYNLLQRSREQTLLEYTDVEGKKILFPSYVIAQYYYYRSPSMSKQVMATYISNEDALKGLYKSVRFLDEDGNAAIVLKPNAKGRDGSEIFRFAVHKYAHTMFHKIYKDLARSSKEIEQKLKQKLEEKDMSTEHKIATLSAFFPFYGISYFKYRGTELSDGRILVLEILAEDSSYPFKSLTIYRQSKSLKNKIVQLGKVFNTLRTNINNFMNSRTPNSIFVPQSVYTQQKMDGRLDLTDKEINYDVLDADDESESTNNVIDINYLTDLSTNEADSSGDLDTSQANIENDTVYKPDGWDERERPGLEAFLIMLEEAQKLVEAKGEQFNYYVNDEQMLPQKPTYDKSRKKWAKSLLIDDETPRAYSCAYIEYNGKNLCVFDVERDKRVKGLSVLIIAMKNNAPVSEGLINNILLDFVKEAGAWLQKVSTNSFRHKTIYHIKAVNEDTIKDWAKRLLSSVNGL